MGIYYENIKYLYKQGYLKIIYKCEFGCYPSNLQSLDLFVLHLIYLSINYIFTNNILKTFRFFH